MNLHLHHAHGKHQAGVSRLWSRLVPELLRAMPELTIDGDAPCDVFMSTYYGFPPHDERAVAMVYDFVHERYPHWGPYNPDAMKKRAAIAGAHAAIAISKATAEDCLRYTNRAATVAYPGCDLTPAPLDDIVAFREKVGTPYVLLVGGRDFYKNAQALYQAWPMWAEHADCTVVCIGGEGDLLPQDRAFMAGYRWLRFAQLDDAELAAAYGGAVALVYPSLYEGFGLPIVEALACGCPVICNDASSMAEIGGEATIYVDVAQPARIAEALAVAATGYSEEGRRMGQEWAAQFTWARMAETVAGVLREVAG